MKGTDDADLPSGWAWTTLGEICGSAAQVVPADIFEDTFIYLDISSIDNEAQCLRV